jgi:hypothetical protein
MDKEESIGDAVVSWRRTLNKEDGGNIAWERFVVARQDKGEAGEVDQKKSIEESWFKM